MQSSKMLPGISRVGLSITYKHYHCVWAKQRLYEWLNEIVYYILWLCKWTKINKVSQELQFLENSAQLNNDQHTSKKPPQKKMQCHALSSDSKDEPLIHLSSMKIVEWYTLPQQIYTNLNQLPWTNQYN